MITQDTLQGMRRVFEEATALVQLILRELDDLEQRSKAQEDERKDLQILHEKLSNDERLVKEGKADVAQQKLIVSEKLRSIDFKERNMDAKTKLMEEKTEKLRVATKDFEEKELVDIARTKELSGLEEQKIRLDAKEEVLASREKKLLASYEIDRARKLKLDKIQEDLDKEKARLQKISKSLRQPVV
jgi:hypothetical protein